MRLTSTRWPTSSVGTIDSDGILYGLIRNAWMPSASPSATATIRTSSRSEPEADEPLVKGSGLGVVAGLVGGRLGGVRLRGGVFQRLRVDGLAGHLASAAAAASAAGSCSRPASTTSSAWPV